MTRNSHIRQILPANWPRCPWCRSSNEAYRNYHDLEWGRPVHDDRQLFEALTLETFQSGLSWECILNRREAFRKAFSDFDFHIIAQYSATRIEELMDNPDIIRHKRKILATVNNASVFIDIIHEYASFNQYLILQTGKQPIIEWDKSRSPLSDSLSADLKRRGMQYIGSTTVYSFLQAIGIIYSHVPGCCLHGQIPLPE